MDDEETERLAGRWAVLGTDRAVEGVLSQPADARAQLALERSFLTPERPALPERIAVHGTLRDGRPVTLLDCMLARRTIGGSDPHMEAWHIGRSVLGTHLADEDTRVFDRVAVTLHGLTEAVGLSGLSITAPGIGPITKRAAVEWVEPEPVESRFGAAGLRLASRGRFEHVSDFHFGLTNHVTAELEPDQQISLSEVDRFVDDLISLVALATEAAVGVREVWAAAADGDARGVTLRSSGRRWHGPDPSTTEPRFALADVDAAAPDFIDNFESFRRDQPEAAELLFEYQVFAGAMNSADRFLYLARFLEAYHRAAVAPKDVFVSRVEHLLQGPGAVAAPAFGGSAQDLAQVIKHTRNYYVHYDPAKRAKALHGIELDDLADRAWCAVRAVLWTDLGMPPSMIAAALDTDWRYRQACASSLPAR
jgi:hypothetical protein